MKRIWLYIFTIVALVSIGSCTDKYTIESTNVHFSLNAGSPETRTALCNMGNGEYQPVWKDGDELGVLFSIEAPQKSADLTLGATLYASSNDDGITATFEGDAVVDPATGSLVIYSFYPATAGKKFYSDGSIGLDISKEQHPTYLTEYESYTFDGTSDLLIAKPHTCTIVEGKVVSDNQLEFTRVSSTLKVVLKAPLTDDVYGEEVKSLTIQTSNADISGRVKVHPATGVVKDIISVSNSKSIFAIPTANTNIKIGNDGTNTIFLSTAPVNILSSDKLTVTVQTEEHTYEKVIETHPDIILPSGKLAVLNITISDSNLVSDDIQIDGNKYVKVTSTSNLTDGKYLIVYEGGNVALNGALTSDVASNTVAVTITNGEIASSTTIDAAAVTYNAANGSFLGGGGKYIGHTDSSNTLNYSDDALANVVTFDSGNVVITAGDYVMKFNDASDQKRFRYYKSGQKSIQLYKYEASTTPDVTLKLIAVSGTPEKTSYTEGDSFNTTGLIVTGTYSDNTTAEITEGITWEVNPETLTAGITSCSVVATVGDISSDSYSVSGLTVSKATAEPFDVTISSSDIPDGFTATTGTSGNFIKDNLSINYSGINTKSKASASDHQYGYAMFLKNYGYIYSSSAPDGYYVSKVVATFSGGTGTSGKVGVIFGSSAITSRDNSVTGSVSQSGTCTGSNYDKSKKYWNFSTTGANVQVTKIVVTYSPVM